LLQLQMQYNLNLTEEKYLSINADKTASLISCACRIGAMLGNGCNGEVDKLTRYGMNLGMAFQITDDLLDITAEEKIFGKPVGSDIREGKMTLPLICVMGRADKRDKEWISTTIRSRQVDMHALNRMKDIITRYHGIEYCMQKAEEYGNACKEELQSLECSESQKTLNLFVDYVVNRAC
jgi:geranylgeranyl pyrophosphate synthase